MLDNIAYQVVLAEPYDQAVEMVIITLMQEGFSVMTNLNNMAVLNEKLNLDHKRWIILGICNSPITLQTEPLMELLLPCNVIVEETTDGSLVSIGTLETQLFMGELSTNGKFEEMAVETQDRLERVAEVLGE